MLLSVSNTSLFFREPLVKLSFAAQRQFLLHLLNGFDIASVGLFILTHDAHQVQVTGQPYGVHQGQFLLMIQLTPLIGKRHVRIAEKTAGTAELGRQFFGDLLKGHVLPHDQVDTVLIAFNHHCILHC